MNLSELEMDEEFHVFKTGENCPDCDDGTLVERYQRVLEGKKFLGCSNFPRCEATFDLEEEN